MSALKSILGRLPKWVSDALFVLVLLGAYLVASIWILPRLGFET